ncbi:P-loop containing nucleoside triphosphate hydrolase protein, partial [Athelia psychrophila]
PPTIIVLGQAGAGKSSLINMIAGKDVAQTSSDGPICTSDNKSYDVELAEGFTVTLWDTAALDQGAHKDRDTVKRVNALISGLEKGVILLIFCFEGRIVEGTVENYQIFRAFCDLAVPTAVVVSRMEAEPDKVGWWKRNEDSF